MLAKHCLASFFHLGCVSRDIAALSSTETKFSGPVSHIDNITSLLIMVYSAVLTHLNVSIKVLGRTSVHHILPSSMASGST